MHGTSAEEKNLQNINKENNVDYCKNVQELIENLFKHFGLSYRAEYWRLFIDFSKTSMKGMLLYNGLSMPSITLTHSTEMSETCKNIKNIVGFISFRHHLSS